MTIKRTLISTHCTSTVFPPTHRTDIVIDIARSQVLPPRAVRRNRDMPDHSGKGANLHEESWKGRVQHERVTSYHPIPEPLQR